MLQLVGQMGCLWEFGAALEVLVLPGPEEPPLVASCSENGVVATGCWQWDAEQARSYAAL